MIKGESSVNQIESEDDYHTGSQNTSHSQQSSCDHYSHPEDHRNQTVPTPGFKPFASVHMVFKCYQLLEFDRKRWHFEDQENVFQVLLELLVCLDTFLVIIFYRLWASVDPFFCFTSASASACWTGSTSMATCALFLRRWA